MAERSLLSRAQHFSLFKAAENTLGADETVEAKVILDSTWHGKDPEAFHRLCDHVPDTYTVVTLKDAENRIVAVIGGYTSVPWGNDRNVHYLSRPITRKFKYEGCKAILFAFDDPSSSQLSCGTTAAGRGQPIDYCAGMCFHFGASYSIFNLPDLSLDGAATLRIQSRATGNAYAPVIYEAVGAKGIKWTDFEYQVLTLSKCKAPPAAPPIPAPAPVPATAALTWTAKEPPLDGPFDGTDSDPVHFLNYIAGLPLPEGIHRANILLLGPVGSGKSSIISTLDSAIKGRISHLAPYGHGCIESRGEAVTQQLIKYKFDLKEDGESRPLPISLWDTMGWNPSQPSYAGNGLEQILDGRLPSGFDLSSAPYEAQPGFKAGPQPGLSERVHAIAFVLSATELRYMATVPREELSRSIAIARSRGVPFFVLLTKIDLSEPQVLSPEPTCRLGAMVSLDTVLRLPSIVSKVKEAADFAGLPRNLAFPIKSYEPETFPAREPAILLLRALPYVLNAVTDAQERRAFLKEVEAAAQPDGGSGSDPGQNPQAHGTASSLSHQAAPSSGSAFGLAASAEAEAKPTAMEQQAYAMGGLNESEASQSELQPTPVLPTASGLQDPTLGPESDAGGAGDASGSGGLSLTLSDKAQGVLDAESPDGPSARDLVSLLVPSLVPSSFEGFEAESGEASEEDYSMVGLVG